MTNRTENSELKDEALRKIGRNVVNFQKIEVMLKQLVIMGNFKGPVSEIAAQFEDKKRSIDRQSMGNVISDYYKFYSSVASDFHDSPKEREEPWMSFSITIENDDGTISEQKNDLSLLVSERNKLIHQMLAKFDPESTDSCQKLILALDDQNVMIQRHYSNIQSMGKALHEGMKQIFSEMEESNSETDGG